MEIGRKIKRLRVKKALTQEELAMRCELSKGFISQLERDLTSPSIATLVDILECLGTNPKEFFNDMEDEKLVFSKEDIFITEDKKSGFKFEWIIPNAQKNLMEPLLLTLEPNSRTKKDFPHSGEEFGYVILGEIYLHIGKEKIKVKEQESFYYKANYNHYISNEKENKAKIIWVSTPPSF
ncbi:MAG: cupin domain-containing protein [Firmicutes bacterium]|nr:cupin domain-containing protein [Bacillota bacterium]